MSAQRVLVTELSPIIQKSISDKSKLLELVSGISKFIDSRSDILYAVGPIGNIVITDADKEIIFNTAGLTRETVKESIKRATYIEKSWNLANDPFNIASALLIRELRINKHDKEANLVLLFLAYRFYSGKYGSYFKFDPDPKIMEWVINNMSKKFIVKQYGSIQNTIKHVSIVSDQKYVGELLHGDDKDIVNYIQSLQTRVVGILRKIANEFYEQKENGNSYINFEGDNLDEENFHLADSDSFLAKRLKDKTLIYMRVNGIQYKLINIAARMNDISEINIRNAIEEISEKKSSEIDELISLILDIFIIENQGSLQDIQSINFIKDSIMLYKKSNTKNSNTLRIKEILDTWLRECSEMYRKSNREDTLAKYRRAVYTYYVLNIQKAAIG